MSIAHVNGADLYFERSGSGAPLVLTHGSWADATAWQGVVTSLSERFEVITWDRRGHTRSSKDEGPGSFDQDAADLAALIEHLLPGPVHVHGTSAGAIVSLRFVASRPDLVMTASVHEPPVFGLLEGTTDTNLASLLATQRRHLDEVVRRVESGRPERAAQYFFDNVGVGPGAWEHFPDGVRAAFVANASTYADELADPTSLTVDIDRLNSSGVPIQVSHGTESPPLILAATRELIQRLPSARVTTLEGVGHVPYRTHPALWLQTVADFATPE